MSRKVKYSPEERLKIVLEGLQGEDSVAEVCRRYGIYPTEYYRYKQLALKGALEGLKANPLRKDREKERLEKEKEKLKRVIVELTLENQLLKKTRFEFSWFFEKQKFSVREKWSLVQLVEESGWSVEQSCKVIELVPSRYYRWKRRCPELVDKKPVAKRILHKLLPEEKEKVIAYALVHPELRHRQLAYRLEREQKVFVSPSSCYRVLKFKGLVCAWQPKLITRKEYDFKTTRANQQWQIDICYIPVTDYFMYLILILDDYSRYIVYFELCFTMGQEDVKRVVEFALLKEDLMEGKEKLQLLSDNGPQLVAISFQQYLRKLGITHLRAAYRHPESKGKIERVFRTIKYEEVFPAEYQSPKEAEEGISRFIQDYNHLRLHQALDYVTPYERYTGKDKDILNQRKERRKKAEENRKFINQLKLTELCERSQTLPPEADLPMAETPV